MTPNLLVYGLGLLSWLALISPTEPQDAVASVRVGLTHPDQEVRLIAVLPGNVLRIVAHEEPFVEASWRADPDDRGEPVVRLSEKSNDVRLEVGAKLADRELRISVPATTSLSIKNEEAGAIYVTDLRGDQEIESRFGDIHLERASGSAVLAAYHGDIDASFVELDVDSTHSFITFRGDVELELPPDLGATLSLTLNSVRIDSELPLESVRARGPSTQVIGDGRARIDITMNRGELSLRVGEDH